MTPEQKQWIDEASLEDLLRKWRFAPSGDLMFQGDTGEYYKEKMWDKRDKAGSTEWTRVSKLIGWDR
jgi:hypothetical protein